MNYEILNQGIGGFGFDQNIVQKLPFIPDKIVVALGTNHYHGWSQTSTRASIEAFFERLCKQYPDIDTLVILPPYTGREQEKEGQEAYEFIRRAIVETVAAYPTVHSVSAYEMIPHRIDYFEQDFLHPSPLGMSAYGGALVDEIRKIGF
jgi:lysophospholipase L1-like esterase